MGYLGFWGTATAGMPFRSEQQSLSSPDLSNPQYLGGMVLLKSKNKDFVILWYVYFFRSNGLKIPYSFFANISDFI